MTRPCQAPDCPQPASSHYSRFCSSHKTRNRRHGDASQKAVSAAELAPFVRRVEARVEKNKGSPVWGHLEDRWNALVAHSQRIAAQTGPMNRYERRAAHEVLKLAEHVEARAIIHTAIAIF